MSRAWCAAAARVDRAEVHRLRERVHLLHRERRRLDARVLLHDDRLRVALAVHGELHGVAPGFAHGVVGAATVLWHGRDRQSAADHGSAAAGSPGSG